MTTFLKQLWQSLGPGAPGSDQGFLAIITSSIGLELGLHPGGVGSCSGSQFCGTSTGAPFSFTKNTRNFAGFVLLAFRPTRCSSSGLS